MRKGMVGNGSPGLLGGRVGPDLDGIDGADGGRRLIHAGRGEEVVCGC